MNSATMLARLFGRPSGLLGRRRVLAPGGWIALGFTRHSGQKEAGLRGRLAAAGWLDVQVARRERDFCVLGRTKGAG